jgi:hypothetical protein
MIWRVSFNGIVDRSRAFAGVELRRLRKGQFA